MTVRCGLVVFLLSDRSGVVTGSVIDWDQAVVGGSTAWPRRPDAHGQPVGAGPVEDRSTRAGKSSRARGAARSSAARPTNSPAWPAMLTRST